MEPPYGTCDGKMTGGATRSDCLRTCRTRQMVKQCGCMDAYMDNSTVNTRVCDVMTMLSCVKPAKGSISLDATFFGSYMYIQTKCS